MEVIANIMEVTGMDTVQSLESKNFKDVIGEGFSVVDFYADWCMPCKMLAPEVAHVAKQYKGKAKFVKVNVEHADDIAAEYQVMSIPTIILFQDGKVVDKSIGLISRNELKEWVSKNVK